MGEYGNDWILTFTNSENMDVYFWRFFGTEQEVKEKLLAMAKEYSQEENLVSCPESLDGIEMNPDTCAWFCNVSYEDYDYVFTAMDFRSIDWKK